MVASAPTQGGGKGVSTAEAVSYYGLELLVWFSAVALIRIRAMLSELHANTLLVNTRQFWLLS